MNPILEREGRTDLDQAFLFCKFRKGVFLFASEKKTYKMYKFGT